MHVCFRYGEPASSPEGSPEPHTAATAQPRKRTGGGGGGGSKTTGPEAWNQRFQDLADFVAKNGFRPRRTAEIDAGGLGAAVDNPCSAKLTMTLRLVSFAQG